MPTNFWTFKSTLKKGFIDFLHIFLAFFLLYRMKHFDRPSVEAMVDVYNRIKAVGLKNVRLGNVGVFAPTEEDQQYLLANVDKGAF